MCSGVTNEKTTVPNFHDGQLLGIIVRDRQCKLFVSDVQGSKYSLVLTDVERLRADNFLLGNIILDVTVRRGVRLNEQDILRVLSLDEGHSGAYRVSIDAIVDRIANDILCFVQVSSSYGCTFESICADITASAVDEDTLAVLGL